MRFLPGLAFFALLPLIAHADDPAKARLERSPRHGEWVTVKSGGRDLKCFVVYPERKDRAPAVLVIHEIFGMTDWVRGVCDQLAEAGFIAIAPDLLSGVDAGDDVRKAISELPDARITADLNAVANYARKIPAATGRLAVAGFCWGGGQAFRYATEDPDLAAVFVFYGPGPTEEAAVAKIHAPVDGFYGEDDARVTATIPASEALMKAAGKSFAPVIYPGAGHGFMRLGEAADASPANRSARQRAWRRWKEILSRL